MNEIQNALQVINSWEVVYIDMDNFPKWGYVMTRLTDEKRRFLHSLGFNDQYIHDKADITSHIDVNLIDIATKLGATHWNSKEGFYSEEKQLSGNVK